MYFIDFYDLMYTTTKERKGKERKRKKEKEIREKVGEVEITLWVGVWV